MQESNFAYWKKINFYAMCSRNLKEKCEEDKVLAIEGNTDYMATLWSNV